MNYLRNKKTDIVLLFFLTAFALAYLLINLNKTPLVDYDEATYAKVVVDTLKSGQLSSLKFYDAPWFVKPPLYFWLAMLSVKLFGATEIAFRLPSIILAIFSLWLVFLITKRLTKNNIIATSAFLILLFSPIFYAFSREIRMESGLAMSMLLVLWSLLVGWKNNTYLILFFPAIAIGFLIKSVVILLIIPITFIYSLFYRNWQWLKSKFLWLGLLISFFILLPWHLIQYKRFGNLFLKSSFS